MNSNEWKKDKLGNFLTLKRGYDLPQQDRIDGSVPIFSSAGLSGYHNEAKKKGPGVITGRYGTLGEVFYTEDEYWPHNTTLYVKDFKGNYPKFIFYFLKTLGFERNNDKTSVPGLNRNDLHEMSVTIPEIEIQKKISSILSSLDDKIKLNRQTNATLEAIAQALFKEWFVDFNYPGASREMVESDLGMIPEGWSAGKLSDIVELNPKLSLKKGAVAKYVEMKDLSENSAVIKRHIEREFSGGSKFQNGDTLLARITPCLENGKTGFVGFLDSVEVGWGSTEFIVMRGKPDVSSYFVYCLSRHSTFREFAIQSMVGSSGRQRVVESILSEFPIAVPTEEVLEKFHRTVQSLFKQVLTSEEENYTLTQLRDSLLPRLMKGEIALTIHSQPTPNEQLEKGIPMA